MTRIKTLAVLAAVGLVLSGCASGDSASTITPSSDLVTEETTTRGATAHTTTGSGYASATPSTEPSATESAGSSTTAAESSNTGKVDPSVEGITRDVLVVDCDDAPEEVAIVCETYDLIKTHYVDEVGDHALALAASQGLSTLDGTDSTDPLVCASPSESFDTTCDIAATSADTSGEGAEAMVTGIVFHALDPNSAYLDARALALLHEEQQGEIEGIGALVSPEDETIPGDNKQCSVISTTCRMLIVSTIAGAPAETAGLIRGDVIVGVDGQSLLGWSVDEVTTQVRGPAGAEVTLTIDREGRRFEVTMTRTAVVIPVIESEVMGDVGYIRLRSFNGVAGSLFEASVVDLLSQGVDQLVIDLRDNPGGFLDTAIDVTSLFIEDGDVVVTQGPGETTSYPVSGTAIVPDDMGVIFVVNKGSASASEVVSATLQERGRVTVVGESTFGKNTVQQRFSLSNGGALKLTIARWLTPGGHDFGGGGVTPDVALDVNALTAEELVAAVAPT